MRAVGELAHVLHAVDDLEVAAGVEVARVAGVEPAVGVLRLGGRLGPLVVLLQQHRSAHQHLALPATFSSTPGAASPTVSRCTPPSGWMQTNTQVSVEP